jgi:hypothetical protein
MGLATLTPRSAPASFVDVLTGLLLKDAQARQRFVADHPVGDDEPRQRRSAPLPPMGHGEVEMWGRWPRWAALAAVRHRVDPGEVGDDAGLDLGVVPLR